MDEEVIPFEGDSSGDEEEAFIAFADQNGGLEALGGEEEEMARLRNLRQRDETSFDEGDEENDGMDDGANRAGGEDEEEEDGRVVGLDVVGELPISSASSSTSSSHHGAASLTTSTTTPPDVVKTALRALRNEAPVGELLTHLNAGKEALIEYLFRCPVPEKEIHVKEELRLMAMSWLLVLDYVKEDVASKGGNLEHVPEDPTGIVQRIGDMAPHKICQFAFKRNDIVWICKNCQKDETCVLCNECFRHSKHEGHEVYFYHTQAGGCCDCGDEDAWDPSGFCHRHGQDGNDPLIHLPPSFIPSARWIMSQSVGFLMQAVEHVMESFDLEHCRDKAWAGPDAEYFLILHNDDVHTKRDVTDALSRTLRMSSMTARTVADQVHAQGDARIHVGPYQEMRMNAMALRSESLLVSLMTKRLHKVIQVALAQVNWLYNLAGVSGGICRLVVEQLAAPTLSRLMRTHGYLPKALASALHTLYLFLMADQLFKSAVAQSYAETYLAVTEDYGRGIGVSEYSLYSLSVQFLNRSAFVNELVGNQNFLTVLVQALSDMLRKGLFPQSDIRFPRDQIYGRVNVHHQVFKYRRYSPVVADLKFVLNIPGVPARFALSCMDAWTVLLEELQYLHSQQRETNLHVPYESRDWMFAFNIQISLCHVLDCLLNWVRTAQSHGAPSVLKVGLQILSRIEHWQQALTADVEEDMDMQQEGVEGIINLPLYPEGQIEAMRQPSRRSFHVILHRSLAFLLREAVKNESLLNSGYGLSELIAYVGSRPRLSLGLLEVPLWVLTLSSEVRVGRWRRNGHVMFDQVVNYAEPPFCRVFRDMDLMLMQLGGLASNPDHLVNLILHRFQVHDWLLKMDATSSCSQEKEETNESLLPLAEECLHLLILLVTELPLPPMPQEERYRQILLREVVHRLASGPCTHSEIHDCCHQFSEGSEAMPESLLESILETVATRREAKELEPEKFALKETAWVDYDPAFFHITVQAHQQASEIRPKPKTPTPMVRSPPDAHGAFAPLRLGLLSSQALLQVVRVVLAEALAATKTTPADHPSLRGKRFSDALLPRSIHLLTLAVHVARAPPQGTPVSGPGSPQAFFESLGASVSSSRGSRAAVAEGSMEVVVSNGEGRGGAAAGGQLGAGSSSSSSIERGGGDSILTMLLALPDAVKSDAHLLHGGHWLTKALAEADPACEAMIKQVRKKTGGGKSIDAEARKRQARERVLSQMQKSAASFLLKTEEDMEEEEEEVEDTSAAGRSNGRSGDEELEGTPECMACRGARSETAGPLGYAAFCQKSNLLSKTGITTADASGGNAESFRHQGTVVHLCGHAIHYGCFDGYFAAVVDQSEIVGHLIYDVTAGEFPCPYCKSISNALIPYIPPPTASLPIPISPASKEGGGAAAATTATAVVPPPVPAYLTRQQLQQPSATIKSSWENAATQLKGHLEALIEEEGMMEEAEQESNEEQGDTDASSEDIALNRCCGLFLADINHPGTSTPPLTTLSSVRGSGIMLPVGPYLGACETVAYTLAVAQAENGHAIEGIDGAQLLRMGWLIRALRHMTRRPSSSSSSSSSFKKRMQSLGVGLDTARSLARLVLGGCSKLNIGRGTSGLLALNEPLLSQNLWCVLMATAVDQSFLEEGARGKASGEVLGMLIRALYLARMLQILADTGGVFAIAGSNDAVAEAVKAAEVSAGLTAQEKLLSQFGISLGTGLGAGPVEVIDVKEVQPRLSRAKERLALVEGAGRAFLSCATLLIQILNAPVAGLGPEKMMISPDWTISPNDADLATLQAAFQVPSLQGVMADAGWMRMLSLWYAEGADWKSQGSGRERRSLDYPVWQKAQFVPLRKSYTELHSELTFRAEGKGELRGATENPALCLVCNAALEAGQGECTRHSRECGRGTGVFFLLQDCSVLLIYGDRASYFPSPYVDAYGERHKQFRGRPLFLDERRLETLRKLWAKQRVAYEVVRSRSSSKHVIHNRFY